MKNDGLFIVRIFEGQEVFPQNVIYAIGIHVGVLIQASEELFENDNIVLDYLDNAMLLLFLLDNAQEKRR